MVITKKADGWYVTFRVEIPSIPAQEESQKPPVGIDVGVVNLIATSDGQTFPCPRWYQEAEEKLSEKQRLLSRKSKGSKRWRKMCWQISRLHQHISNQRKDLWHKLTTYLVRKYGIIVVEELDIEGMVGGPLPKQILDAGWGLALRMLDYKAWSAGGLVLRVFPNGTSQLCSGCGSYVPKKLSQRIHDCPFCGLVIDRDINAARNILKLGLERALGVRENLTCPKEAVVFRRQ